VSHCAPSLYIGPNVRADARGDQAARASWLIAPDKFRGTHSAHEVGLAIARGLGTADALDICPVADGGEGTMEILLAALGGVLIDRAAHDPLGRSISAALGVLDDRALAIVEVARASGLGLLSPSEIDAEAASTAGTGELIAAALTEGVRTVVVAAGGSATTDGGAGAIQAIERAGGLRGAKLIVLTDVRTPFERAAEVFGPQKGADPNAVKRLTARLQRQADTLPRDPRGVPMSGAAGGLSGGLWARYDATIVPGARWVLDAIGFDERLGRARAVITGEGRIDSTTLEGKAVFEIAVRCARAGVPVHAVVGSSALTAAESARLTLASIREASSIPDLEAAGRALAASAG
jgi:glycerate kinase